MDRRSFIKITAITGTSGTYANAANWSNGVPNGIGADAVFDGASGAASISVSAPVTLRSMAFNSANSYAIGGSSTITLSGTTSGNSSTIACNAGTHTVSAPINSTDHLSLYVVRRGRDGGSFRAGDRRRHVRQTR